MTRLAIPDPVDPTAVAVWTGEAFLVIGSPPARVLAYGGDRSGWSDDLTQLHEQSGGSDHFIDVASREYAVQEISRAVSSDSDVILEVGCSSGFLLADVCRHFPRNPLVGSDYTLDTLRVLGERMPGIPLMQFDLARCPLPDNFANIIVLLNVLEHIPDHEAAVRHLCRIIRPGGVLIVEVPAGSHLYDVYDRVLMHERRYDMSELLALLAAAGFSIQRRSYLGFLLYPGFYLSKRLNQVRYPEGKAVDAQAIVAKMIAATKRSSAVMRLVMNIEKRMRRYFRFPFGVRCLVTCRRPASDDPRNATDR